MARTLTKGPEYRDASGNTYCATTNDGDDAGKITTAEDVIYDIQDGGDCTVTSANKFTKRELSIAALGTGR